MAMCLNMYGIIGCAYVDADGLMQVMQDAPEDRSNWDLASRLVIQVEPEKVFVPGRIEGSLIDTLKPFVREVDIRPTAEFNPHKAKAKLTGSPWEQTCEEAGEQGLRCVGALLFNAALLGVTVRDVRQFSLAAFMSIDGESLEALQVFDRDPHPSMHHRRENSNGSGGKEGFSLFNALDRTRTDCGRKLLRLWMSRPLVEEAAIRDRHDAVAWLVGHEVFLRKLQTDLARIPNIALSLSRMHVASTVADFRAVMQFCSSVCRLRDSLNSGHSTAGLPRLLSELIEEGADRNFLRDIGAGIDRVIEFGRSTDPSALVVPIRKGINDRLDELRRVYNGLPQFLAGVMRDEIPVNSSGINVVYFPQLGFLLTVPRASDGSTPTPLPDLTQQVYSGKTLIQRADTMFLFNFE